MPKKSWNKLSKMILLFKNNSNKVGSTNAILCSLDITWDSLQEWLPSQGGFYKLKIEETCWTTRELSNFIIYLNYNQGGQEHREVWKSSLVSRNMY